MAYKANSIYSKISSSIKNDPEKKKQDPVQDSKTKDKIEQEPINPSVRDAVGDADMTGEQGEWGNKYDTTEEFIGSLRGDELRGIVEHEGADTPEERAKAYKTLSKKPNYDGDWENEYEGWQLEEGVVTDYDTAYKDRNRDTYGDMSKEEYIEEAKRQKKSFIDTGDFDAPTDKLVNSAPYKQKGFSGIQKQKRKY